MTAIDGGDPDSPWGAFLLLQKVVEGQGSEEWRQGRGWASRAAVKDLLHSLSPIPCHVLLDAPPHHSCSFTCNSGPTPWDLCASLPPEPGQCLSQASTPGLPS